ncbi:hypothetical protein BC829DRAFT_406365 [Chytridium lagenaria]|nr:hypothetical protein BC829DRAFT_406365 [Chytridium lagenaria]
MEDEDVLNSLYAELLLQQQATTAVGGGVGGDVLATLYYSLPAFFNSTRLQQPLQQQQQVPSAIPHSASSWMQLLRSQIPSLSAPFTPNPSTTTSTTSNLQPSSTAATAHSRYSSYIASLKSLTSKVPNLRADGKMTLFLRNLQEALAPASSPVSLQQTPVLGDSSVDPWFIFPTSGWGF